VAADESHDDGNSVVVEGDEIGGKYVVDAILGEGGMGVVVRAHHKIVLNRVAVKLLRPEIVGNPSILARFQREARASNEIGHPGFVRTLDFGTFKGRPYIVMDYLTGWTVLHEVRTSGPLPVGRVVKILRQVCNALQAAHDRGVVHRDIKGENVYICEGERAVILDMGVAKFFSSENKTATSVIIGTPHTMSPEQCRGSAIDHRSDIYAVAVLAFFMLTGHYPFEGYQGDILTAHLRDDPPRVRLLSPWVPAAFSDLIYRNMAKRPEDRAQSMSELEQALAYFSESKEGPPESIGRQANTKHEKPRPLPTVRADDPAKAVTPPSMREDGAPLAPMDLPETVPLRTPSAGNPLPNPTRSINGEISRPASSPGEGRKSPWRWALMIATGLSLAAAGAATWFVSGRQAPSEPQPMHAASAAAPHQLVSPEASAPARTFAPDLGAPRAPNTPSSLPESRAETVSPATPVADHKPPKRSTGKKHRAAPAVDDNGPANPFGD